jgi:hypothetical protein
MKKLFYPLIILSFASCSGDNSSTTEPTSNQEKKYTPIKKYSYEVIGTKHNNAVENFYILLKTSTFSEDTIKEALMTIKSELCTRKCNVSAYDDKKYFEMENEYEDKKMELGKQLGNGQITQAQWKKENSKLEKKYYVKIADHLVGYVEFSDENFVMYYPYKDFKYKELGGKHSKNK